MIQCSYFDHSQSYCMAVCHCQYNRLNMKSKPSMADTGVYETGIGNYVSCE